MQNKPKDALQHVHVRPIEKQEKALYDKTMAAEHPLGATPSIGRCIHYVVEYEEDWIGLLSFGASARHLRARDEWIGWTREQRRMRVNLSINNTRFLCRLAPGAMPNLASRVLKLILDRVQADWTRAFGFAPLLAETFVDPEAHAGTCYKAAGWVELGYTSGYKRDATDFYVLHDRPKRIFVRELEAGAREALAASELAPAQQAGLNRLEPESVCGCTEYASLFDRLRRIEDPRHHNRHYNIGSLLAITAAAVLSGIQSVAGLGRFSKRLSKAQCRRLRCPKDLQNPGGFRRPCEGTFRNLFLQMDLDVFDRELGGWIAQFGAGSESPLAFDGKRPRGLEGGVGLLAVLEIGGGVVHQVAYAEGQEQEAARRALGAIDIEGRLVTGDALHAQAQTAHQIVQEQGGDYLLQLKDNQSGVRAKALERLASQAAPFCPHLPKKVTAGSRPGACASSR